MSHAQQDPAAASAPFDSRANGSAVRALAQGRPSDSSARGAASRTLAQGSPSESSTHNEPREISVVVKRFTFEPSRIEVTEGERIRLLVTSEDGVHGVEIKKVKVNKKVPRGGEQVTIDFLAPAAGEYPIVCSEYCGNDHEEMKGALVVAVKAAAPNGRNLRVGVGASPR